MTMRPDGNEYGYRLEGAVVASRSCRWRHVWRVVEKTEHPSFLEQLGPGGSAGSVRGDDPHRRAVIVTYRCATCGTETVERV